MEQLLYLSALFDFYGALLTEKQQECLKMHLFEDFSLSEIGEELGISRQAVYDNIHRSEKAMESYEEKLGLVALPEGARGARGHLPLGQGPADGCQQRCGRRYPRAARASPW